MALTVTDKVIRGTDTRHVAELHHFEAGDAWRVTWLPLRLMDKDAAIAAMEIAEAVGQMPADCGPELWDDTFWSRIDALADRFGLHGPDAVARASESPEDAAERAAGEAGE